MSTKKLFIALAKAQADLPSIGKDGDGPRGEYVSVDAAVAASKAALALHSLSLVQTSLRLEELAAIPVEKEGEELKRRLVLKREMILIHTESGETLPIAQTWPVNMHGSRAKSIDHNVAAADSFGLTYLLRGLLLFPRGDEHDTSDRPRETIESRHPGDRDQYGAKTYHSPRNRNAQAMKREELPSKAKETIDVDAKVTPRETKVVNYAELVLTGKLSKSACADVKEGGRPVNVTAQTLIKEGWTKSPNPEDLEVIGDGLVPDTIKKALWKSAKELAGDKLLKGLWGALVPAKTNPTGYQALLIATLAQIRSKK